AAVRRESRTAALRHTRSIEEIPYGVLRRVEWRSSHRWRLRFRRRPEDCFRTDWSVEESEAIRAGEESVSEDRTVESVFRNSGQSKRVFYCRIAHQYSRYGSGLSRAR